MISRFPQAALRFVLRIAITIALFCPGCTNDEELSYLERRAVFETQLTRHGPAPEAQEMAHYPDWSAPEERIREIQYPSGDMPLKALVFVPESAVDTPAPALVYLHGALQLSEHTISNTRPFIEAGFVVMAPTFRGEPGNPGFHEFVLGEAEDAAAAILWLARQPFVDPDRVYVFGWSSGGGIAAQLSLFADLPVQHGGSVSGLGDAETVEMMGLDLPFNIDDARELEMRALVGNQRWMQHRHYAFAGSADLPHVGPVARAVEEMESGPTQLEVIMVPGDTFSSFHHGIEGYLNLILQDMN